MRSALAAMIGLSALSLTFAAPVRAADEKEPSRHREVIVQSANLDEATEAIDAVGGVVSHELKVIHAVGVRLTEEQITQLRKRAKDLKLRIYTDFPQVRVDGGSRAAKAAEKAAKEAAKAAEEALKEAEKAAKEAEKAAKEAAKEAEEAAEDAAEQAEEAAEDALEAAKEAEKAREKAEKDASKGKTDADKLEEADQAEREAAEAAARAAAADDELRRAEQSAAAAEAYQAAARASRELTRARQHEIDREAKQRVAERRRRDKDARWGLDTEYPTLIDADKLHKSGIDGSGVTIAVIDTGIWTRDEQVAEGLATDATGRERILAQYNAIVGTSTSGSLAEQLSLSPGLANDGYGHGTHVASVAVSSLTEGKNGGKGSENGNGNGNGSGSVLYNGIAPNADLVVVKAFDDSGLGSYLDVIRAVDWVIQNQHAYGIRVLNLSFSGEPRSYYWDDPLNQAVMAAWQSGIVVVASAGNRGPDPMTVGVPGNTPYVITVGAMSDSMSNSPSDDFLASFSSTGPTFEGFVKPEMVAPGGHVMGLMSGESQIAVEYPEFHDGGNYFVMSGTSQSTAIVSGVAALMLQADPTLTPDEIKCRLMASARPAAEQDAVTGEMWLAYSVFQQGAGLVNARDAVETMASACANRGLNVELDLLGKQHYRGRANFSETDGFYLEGLQGDGYLWNDGYLWSDGHKFREGYVWPDGFLWNDGYLWNDGFLWNDGYLWSDGFLWNDVQSSSVSTNAWVPQE